MWIATEWKYSDCAPYMESSAMTAKTLGIREAAVSAIVFSAILFALVSVDPRVKSVVTDSLSSGSAWSLGNRFGEIGDALWSAVRNQSMDNAPLLVFATVGAVLTVFMLRA
jgi:glucose uptake protein GlcU